MVGYICPTHTVSVTYKLGVTAAGMISHAPSPRPTEGKRPIGAWLLAAGAARRAAAGRGQDSGSFSLVNALVFTTTSHGH
jgi:hypothetical protein